MCRARCDSVAWESIVIIIIIIIIMIGVIIVSIIWSIVVIIVMWDGGVNCRWVQRGGSCWFFRGYSCHPRVDLYYDWGVEWVSVLMVVLVR